MCGLRESISRSGEIFVSAESWVQIYGVIEAVTPYDVTGDPANELCASRQNRISVALDAKFRRLLVKRASA